MGKWRARMAWWWDHVGYRSLALVCLAAIMERADEVLVPSVYRELGRALSASPSKLGSLTLVRSLTQAAFAPLAGFLAQQYNRANIIAVGAILWAISTVAVGVSTTFTQVAIFRALNGVGLAVVGPAMQSMVADATDDNNRGKAFGWLQVAGNMGSIVGGFCAVMMADTIIFGVEGWRMAFHLVAAMSLVVAFLVYMYAVDPQFSTSEAAVKSREGRSFWDNAKIIYEDMGSVVKVRSFQIFVAQGVVGSFPWAALAFAPMWLELVGFSNEVTAILMGCWVFATSLGGLFGGWLGDYLSVRLPNSGRIIMSQVSAGLGVPLGAILLLLLPVDPSTPWIHGIAFFIMGLCISWNGSATNGPIFAEIVPEKSRTNVYALDRAFESVLASFAPPVVGLLAEHVYGYDPPPKGTYSLKVDKENAVALSKALYTSIGVPFVLCASIYTGLYWTYPKDRARVQQIEHSADELLPLDEVTSKEAYIWTVGEEDEEEEDEKFNLGMNVEDGLTTSETERMLPKHH